MKKVIEGKVYNTATATKLAEYSYGYSSDFSYISEELYVTQKGNYFIAGEGGPRTCYAERVDSNTYCGGEAIIPMTRREAFEWCQEHDCTEAIDEHFSDLVEEA